MKGVKYIFSIYIILASIIAAFQVAFEAELITTFIPIIQLALIFYFGIVLFGLISTALGWEKRYEKFKKKKFLD